MPNQDINLTTYDPNAAAIQRQQRLAELLGQQATSPIEILSGGGAQAPINPLAALAKGFQGYASTYLDRKAQDKAAALQQGYRKDLASQLANFYQKPATPGDTGYAPQTIDGTAPNIPGAPPPNPVTAQMPGQAATGPTGPQDTSTQERLASALQMMNSGNPYSQQMAPQLYAAALNRDNTDYSHKLGREDKKWELEQPMGVGMGQQIAAQSAATQANAAFANGLGPTAYQSQSLALDRAKLGEEHSYHQAMVGGNVGDDDPVAKSWAQNVAAGNATMQNVPKQYKNTVSKMMANAPQAVFTPLAGSRFTLEANRIASPFMKLPQYELTAQGLPYLQRIDAARKVPGSVSDQDLLDSLTKLNTAGNAITDAQVRIITDGRSFGDAVNVYANKLKTGGVLSNDQRQQIFNIAHGIYDNYKKGYQPVYDQVIKQYDEAGIPNAFRTIPDLNKLTFGQAGTNAAPAPGGANIAPAGTKATGPGGKTLTSDGKGGWN